MKLSFKVVISTFRETQAIANRRSKSHTNLDDKIVYKLKFNKKPNNFRHWVFQYTLYNLQYTIN